MGCMSYLTAFVILGQKESDYEGLSVELNCITVTFRSRSSRGSFTIALKICAFIIPFHIISEW